MKKFLKKLDKKTQWIFPFYFYAVHSFGILMFSLFIASAITRYIVPNAENVSYGFFMEAPIEKVLEKCGY